MAPLNVVYIRDHMQAAGGSTYLLNTLPRFDAARLQASLVVLGPVEGALDKKLGTVRCMQIDRAPGDPRRLIDLWRMIGELDPDLLVLCGPRAMRQGRVLGRLMGVPTLVRVNWMYPVGRLETFWQRQLTGSRHGFLAVSQAMARWAKRSFDLVDEHIHIEYPAHDWRLYAAADDKARARLRREFDIDPAVPVVLLLGRLKCAEKGQDVMLDALPRILDIHDNAVLVLVGDGPDRSWLEARVRDAGLAGSVRLAGYREDVPDLLSMSDVVAAPSSCDEAFGLVALEAHAAGRPVVVTDSGGLVEFVEHDVNGLVVRKRDPLALAEAIARLLASPELVDALVTHGRSTVSRFDIDAHLHRLETLYARHARKQRLQPAQLL